MLTALESFGLRGFEAVEILIPKLYLYDKQSATLVTSDFRSSTDLKSYLSKHDVIEEQADRLGKAFGQWTHELHDWAKAPEQRELVNAMSENKTIAQFKCYLNYGRLEETIATFPEILSDSREIFQKVYALRQEEKETANKSLIHGDFWSGK